MQMVMTNYMDLLAQNQPWNLILFMVVPVVLEESVVAMVFGMVDPTLTGYQPAPAMMHQMDGMPMQHGGMQHNMDGMQK